MKKILTTSLLFIFILLTTSCRANKIYECSPIYAFDTVVSMVFYQDDYEKHYNVIKDKINELSRITNDFSSNSTNTSLYDLNSIRELEVSDDLIDIINKSIELKNDTNGYFNPFMGRLTHLWKNKVLSQNNNDVMIPTAEEINNELSIVNSTSVEINNNVVRIIGEGNIDLGGMVKGYVLEWIRNYLKDNNISKYYVDCGSSSIYISGVELKVAITKPYNSGYIKEITVENKGVATSNGKHQNKMIDGVRYHHLINPFTGYPSNNYDSISIIASIDNTLLDAYSTAMFSMDEEMAKSFAKEKKINLLLYKDGKETYIINE